MRHRVKGRKLSRSASHRRALLRSLSTELIRHKRITTTEAKAKEAARYVEALITRAKRAYLAEKDGGEVNLHSRRVIARDINDRDVIRELFTEVAAKVADRPGGYTRVVRIGQRQGDGAELAVVELVDYNTERDESAVRSRSKNVMSRSERVRRSQEKQQQKGEPAAAATPTAPAEEELPESPVDTAPEVETEQEGAIEAANEAEPTNAGPAESEESAGEEQAGRDAADEEKNA